MVKKVDVEYIYSEFDNNASLKDVALKMGISVVTARK